MIFHGKRKKIFKKKSWLTVDLIFQKSFFQKKSWLTVDLIFQKSFFKKNLG